MLPAFVLAAFALSAKQASAIDRIVRHVMRAHAIAGLSLGVARGRDTLALRGYGVRDRATGAPADAYTIYRIGSITKQFTAALVLDAAERGELPLDARIRDELAQSDGVTWRYDNANYLALGAALERATGSPFSHTLRERILEPLHLISTSVSLPRAYNVAVSPLTRERDFPQFTGSAAAMSSNVPDLLRWLEALFAGRVVTQADVTAMTTTRYLRDGRPTNYGYGFFVTRWYGRPIAEHPGYLDGFSALDAIDTGNGIAIVILTNADRVDLAPLAMSILAIVEPLDRTQVASLNQPAENENPAATKILALAIAQLAAGTIDAGLLTPTFRRRLNRDELRAFRERLAPLGPLRAQEFLSREGGMEHYRLSFDRAQLYATMRLLNGKIDALHIESTP